MDTKLDDGNLVVVEHLVEVAEMKVIVEDGLEAPLGVVEETLPRIPIGEVGVVDSRSA